MRDGKGMFTPSGRFARASHTGVEGLIQLFLTKDLIIHDVVIHVASDLDYTSAASKCTCGWLRLRSFSPEEHRSMRTFQEDGLLHYAELEGLTPQQTEVFVSLWEVGDLTHRDFVDMARRLA